MSDQEIENEALEEVEQQEAESAADDTGGDGPTKGKGG